MATLLQRLGLFSARRRWLVVIAWVVILGGVITAYETVGGSLSTTFSIPGTPAQKANEQLAKSFKSASGGTGQIVFSTADGKTFTATEKAGVADALSRAGELGTVSGTVDPFTAATERAASAKKLVDDQTQIATARTTLAANQAKLDAAIAQLKAAGSAAQPSATAQLAAEQMALTHAKATLTAQAQQLTDGQRLLKNAAGIKTVSTDGSTAVATVEFTQAINDVTPAQLSSLRDTVGQQKIAGVDVEFTSALAGQSKSAGATDAIGLAIAAIVLFIMLGSLVAAGLPLLSAIVGVAVGAVGVLAFSGVVSESSTTPTLGLMLGLAVGIDYSLFILNRHRRNLRAGMPMRQSIGLATGTSGSAVLFAGITVIIALVALNVTGIAFLGLLGSAAAACVAVAVLVALTFTPAMLAFADAKSLPKKQRHLIRVDGSPALAAEPVHPEHAAATVEKSGNIATRHPVVVLVAGIIVLLVIALPALNLRLGLPDGSSEPQNSTQYKAYTQIGRAFGEGTNGAIIVVVNAPKVTTSAELTHLEANVADKLMQVHNVTAVGAGGASSDNRTLIYQVIPKDGPSAATTEQVVADLRNLSPTLDKKMNVTLGVTGLTATNIDISAKLGSALPIYLIVVLGLSILVMILVFRSILIPVMATAGFLLSILATLGAVTAVFQYGWGEQVFGLQDPAPILSFLPTLLIGIVFGLAMDYQIFLVSGMREAYVRGHDPKEAVKEGLNGAKAVVTAAGIIMIGVFSGFALSKSSTITPVGFGLASGVLIDAFVVRMLLIPAIMTVLGKSAWWLPRWIDKILPDVDVEGQRLLGEKPSAETGEIRVHAGATA
jgi:RND superfamily putative drug exporter